MKRVALLLLVGALAPAFGAETAVNPASKAAINSAIKPVADEAAPLVHSPAASLLAKPVTLRGKLGDQAIQVHLQLKVQVDEGIEGDYFLFGRTQKILLAGEVDNNTLSLEESENGTDISGQWDGKIDGNVIRGTWTSADASMTKPFEVTAVTVAATVEKKSEKPARHSRKVAGTSSFSVPGPATK